VLASLNVPVAVNCCVVPLTTEEFAGVTAIDTSDGGGLIVSCAVAVPLYVAVIVAVVGVLTVFVVTVNVAVPLPANTVTLPGTVAAVLSLDRVTVAPPAGAADANVTVPVELFPAVTAFGFKFTFKDWRAFLKPIM
jgi:hypothetical protein